MNPTPTTLRQRAVAWAFANRSSARLAFILRVLVLGMGAVLSIFWARLLLRLVGDGVYGTYVTFQRAMQVTGLGDFGISGGLAVRVGQMYGRGEHDRLRSFLASARTALLCVGSCLGIAACVLSPWLPRWLGFSPVPGAGSLSLLFVVGSASVTAMLLISYFQTLNSAYATVTWPIIPLFLLNQMSLAGQCLIAKLGGPLWMQSFALLASVVAQGFTLRWMVRVAHPWLGETFPLGRDRAHWRELFGASGWVYLFSVGNLIFSATDSLLINKGFGPEAVTPYQLNYRIVELIIQVIGSAAVIGMSKINLWIHSPEPENKERARSAVERLLTFQSSVATFGAMAYLAIDSMLIGTIFGHWRVVSLPLQWAFALNLAVTMCGDAGIQVAGIATRTGVRTAGAAIGVTALVNLALSYTAMKMGSIPGIAYATVIAQTLLSWFLGWHVCRVLKLNSFRWMLRSWLLPTVFVSATAWVQWRIGPGTWAGAAILFVIVCVLGIVHARLAGVNREFLRKELSVLRSFLPN